MQRIPNPSNKMPLSEVPVWARVLDPRGREGRKNPPKEGDLQCEIHLRGWKKSVFYDWDVEVEVLNSGLPQPFIYPA
jgi:hypothetical protein